MNKDKIVLRFSTRFVETVTHQLSSSDRSASSPGISVAIDDVFMHWLYFCNLFTAKDLLHLVLAHAQAATAFWTCMWSHWLQHTTEMHLDGLCLNPKP